MNLNLYNTLMLAGLIQGFIFVLLVSFSKRFKNPSIRYLSLLILILSITNLQYFINDARVVSTRFFFDYLYLPLATLNPVFFYFYVLLFLFPEEQISKRKKKLYLPFIVFFSISLVYKILNQFIPETKQDFIRSFFWQIYLFQELFAWGFSVYLIIKSYGLIQKYQRQSIDKQKFQPQLPVQWLKTTIIILLGFLSMVWLVLTLINLFYTEPPYYILWIGVSFTIYWMGHLGIYKYGINLERQQLREFATKVKVNISDKIPIHSKKNKNLSLIENYLIEDKNYLDPNLTLEKTAIALNLNKTYLSRIFNQEMGKSFSDYINQLRIEEAKKYMENDEFENYTLVAIGLEAGFNSKTAFYNAFKKFENKTPAQYRKQNEPTSLPTH